MIRDLTAIAIVVVLGVVAALVIPRCSLDVTRPVVTTTTTDFRDVVHR